MGRKKKFVWTVIAINLGMAALVGLGGIGYVFFEYQNLPKLITVADYKPLLSSDIFSRDGEKIGELYSKKEGVRYLTPLEQIPETLINAFLAAEDATFYEHGGVNYTAILRAIWVNVISGQKRQGASTITLQTARSLFLSPEKTYVRKLREVLLAYKMEKNLTKKEILYLYLNQIYLGQGAYGVAAAAETYFRKTLDKLTLAEMAMMAALPVSPGRMNPVLTPARAKERQMYVISRMIEVGFITEEDAAKARSEILVVQTNKNYKKTGPYFVETVRQLLTKELGEEAVYEQGLKIYTSLDTKAQAKAIESVNKGLREVDKRRGYRGPKMKLDLKAENAVTDHLTALATSIIKTKRGEFELLEDGSVSLSKVDQKKAKSALPYYLSVGEVVEGVVTKVDDSSGMVYVDIPEGKGIIPLADMAWARKLNPDLHYGEHLNIKKPSSALTAGDVIDVKIVSTTFSPTKNKKTPAKSDNSYADYFHFSLEQEPEVQGAMLSFDLETKDIVAMVGGLDYTRFKFNRTYQAQRQSGSSFKPIVYAAGLEKGLTVATPIMGSPVVYGTTNVEPSADTRASDGAAAADVWKPENFDGSFTGDILMRNALKRSLNMPTIRILEKATTTFAAEYARRLGIVSPLNMDMSLALGSSGISMYEMTKAFAIFANSGKRFVPVLVREVKAQDGSIVVKNLSLDLRFKEKLDALEQEFQQKREEYKKSLEAYHRRMATQPIPQDGNAEKPPVNAFFFDNPDQLISANTAYLVTNMLQGVAMEPDGTGGKAAALGRPVAGKTGTTNGYFDTWFLGFSAQYVSSVWVGFDTEKIIGRGETGSSSALPIWMDYMATIHENLPVLNFEPPADIVFANVNKDTGKRDPGGLRLPFVRGTEPGAAPQTFEEQQVEEKDFLRESF
ncbi:MAG: PBP1A family penicillin-binding protein [Bdellovibrionaceae bacterium]|nr:PBP1A family penicillin-binding protein [Pseudobdellovibrionaceae bacterium]